MKIAFIGINEGNTKLLRLALERLGHTVDHADPYVAIAGALKHRWSWQTGNLFLSDTIERQISSSLKSNAYDLVFVDSGELVSEKTVIWLKSMAAKTLLFCRDNPFVSRDGLRWRLLKSAIRHYDLFVTRRDSTAASAQAHGVRRVETIILPADEVAHRPLELTAKERHRFASEVAFVGTWMPGRDDFVRDLLRRGVPLRVFGPRWERATRYAEIRHCVTLGTLSTAEFARAISATKIALSLLSKGNQDLHTARSVEIPALGRLLCTERTSDHNNMYLEGVEAVFWANADECADVCLELLLAQTERIERIAAAGRQRIIKDGRYNEPTWGKILNNLFGSVP